MLIIEEVEVKWSGNNRKHYERKGYIYTGHRTSLMVKNTDLSKGSHAKVRVLCDYCKTETMTRAYKTHILQSTKPIVDKDCCKACRPLKMQESNLITYGTSWITQTENFKEKSKATNLERYGAEYYQSTEEYREKSIATHLERYGVEYTFQHQVFVEKREKTFMLNYGVNNPMKSPIIQQKIIQTLYKNGTAPSSSQQNHIHSLVGGELNYPEDRIWLDIAFTEDKIYLEYDGGGHDLQVKLKKLTQDEFDAKERKRSFFLRRRGWKEIRIITTTDKLPEDFVIVNFVDKARSFLIDENIYSIQLNLDTKNIIINYNKEFTFDEFQNEKFNSDSVKEVA